MITGHRSKSTIPILRNRCPASAKCEIRPLTPLRCSSHGGPRARSVLILQFQPSFPWLTRGVAPLQYHHVACFWAFSAKPQLKARRRAWSRVFGFFFG